MHNRAKLKLEESVEGLKEEETNFTERQLQIIKSLPESERLKIFKSMLEHRKESSAYKAWLDLDRAWKVAMGIILIILYLLGLK
jgi:hypothetical protein